MPKVLIINPEVTFLFLDGLGFGPGAHLILIVRHSVEPDVHALTPRLPQSLGLSQHQRGPRLAGQVLFSLPVIHLTALMVLLNFTVVFVPLASL